MNYLTPNLKHSLKHWLYALHFWVISKITPHRERCSGVYECKILSLNARIIEFAWRLIMALITFCHLTMMMLTTLTTSTKLGSQSVFHCETETQFQHKMKKRTKINAIACTTKNVLNKLTDIRIPATPIVLATMDEEKIGNGLTSHDNCHRFHFFCLFFFNFQKQKTERRPLLSCDGKRKIVTMLYIRRQMRKSDERAQIIA